MDACRVPNLVLAIETSNPTAHPGAGAVALGRPPFAEGDILGSEPVATDSRLDDDLLPAIARLCARCAAAPSDLGAVAVSCGPGGYTSVRMAVACAGAIARARGIPVLPVPSALGAAVDAASRAPDGAVLAVCVAWKGSTVWRHRFRGGAGPVPLDHGALVPVEQAASGADVLVADSAFLAQVGSSLGNATPVEIRFRAECLLMASRDVAAMDPADVRPIYPREPEAVTKWNALRARDIGTGSARD